MNDFFVEQTILDESNATLPPNIDPPENNLNSISTSPHEVESILKSLQLGKASGPDEISNHILKKLATPLSSPLSNLFNFSLATGKVPLLWKEANVTPIFKKKMILLSFLIIDLSLFKVQWARSWKKLYISIYLTIFVTMKFCLPYSQVLFPEIQQ